MSLGTLLAAGKSWAGGEGTGRYRMRDGIRLPKFMSPQNPFKPEAGAETSATGARDGRDGGHGAKPAAAVQTGNFSWLDFAGRGVRRAVSFCREQNPLARLGRPKLPGIPRFGKRPVQSEFSLERVQVLRSDLTDADLEIIPAARPDKTSDRPAWKKLTARLVSGRSEQKTVND